MISRPLARWVLWALLVASLQTFGCREQTPRINVERVVGPAAADIVDLVASGGGEEPLAVARSSDFLWVRGSSWEASRPFEGGAWHRQAMAESDSMIWARGAWWWLELGGDEPVLRRSSDGRVWDDFALPGTALTPGGIADRNAVPTVHLTLQTALGSVYLIGPMRIWRLDQSGEPVWHRVDLDGVALEESGDFPAFIRNYLPRTSEREFELLTTFGRQLKVYRRVAADLPWTMVSSLSTIDRELVGTADGASIFVVAPDGLRRSSDEGETWFRFWPDDAASLTTIAFVADNGGQLGYALLAGASDGTILRSLDQGTTWSVAVEGGPAVARSRPSGWPKTGSPFAPRPGVAASS